MKTLFEVCVKQMNEDNSRFWTVFHVFTLMNGGLLALSASSSTNPEVKLGIAIVAGLICVLWRQIQARMGFWSRRWEEDAERIEELYVADVNEERQRNNLPPLPNTAKVFLGRKPKTRGKGEKRWPGMSTRNAGTYLPLLFLLAWVLFFGATLRGL
ncbi:MAG: hypothetical protein KKH04_07530 [Proteobacteria bacterium]|nr:hypothetical protein [Pseudomonadota bacterium]